LRQLYRDHRPWGGQVPDQEGAVSKHPELEISNSRRQLVDYELHQRISFGWPL
jgi:hypothetical protein